MVVSQVRMCGCGRRLNCPVVRTAHTSPFIQEIEKALA